MTSYKTLSSSWKRGTNTLAAHNQVRQGAGRKGGRQSDKGKGRQTRTLVNKRIQESVISKNVFQYELSVCMYACVWFFFCVCVRVCMCLFVCVRVCMYVRVMYYVLR